MAPLFYPADSSWILFLLYILTTAVYPRSSPPFGGGVCPIRKFGDALYISTFTVLGLRIDEVVALLLYYCLSSLYRLTHPGQWEIQSPYYLSHTYTKVSYRPIAQQAFCLNVHKNHNFKTVNVKGVPEALLGDILLNMSSFIILYGTERLRITYKQGNGHL